jgi:hypothetical protein
MPEGWDLLRLGNSCDRAIGNCIHPRTVKTIFFPPLDASKIFSYDFLSLGCRQPETF